mgnify:CR=1 FL=1
MKLKLNEFRRLIKKLVKEEQERHSSTFGWGTKDQQHPDVPWMRKSKEHALHNDREVFRKFVTDMLGFDPDKETTSKEDKEE